MAIPAECGSEALKEITAVKLGLGERGREASVRGKRGKRSCSGEEEEEGGGDEEVLVEEDSGEEGEVDGNEGW